MDFVKQVNKEIVKKKVKSISGIIQLRDRLAKKLGPKHLPSLITIFAKANKREKEYLRKILKSKPSRTLSGVTPIAVMTKPSNCPSSAKCIYCPGGLKSQFGDTPKSYTGHEPASMRAKRNLYDSYLQVFNRLEHYVLLNQDISKCEVIVMGGTFTGFNKKYQKDFVKYIFKAMNDFSRLFFVKGKFDYGKFSKFFELDKDFKDSKRIKSIISKVRKLKGKCELKKEQKKNEKTNCRVIGLTLETRPDCVTKKIGEFMLELGATRVELGVQSLDDIVLKFVKRGHTVEDSAKAIKILKDLGFKINLHYMIFFKNQLKDMKKLFSDKRFRPDMLKIYPCMIFPKTKLYNKFRKGEYKQVTTKDAAELISKFKNYVERYCRIMRVQRDIPPKWAIGGVDRSNLRQYIKNVKCKCIRCREIGRNEKIIDDNIYVDEYNASGGKEFFISIGKDPLIGFVRLRFISKDVGIIRELHVYSSALRVGSKGKGFQHKGYGKKLLDKAEEICLNNGKKKLLVISGIGVKEYYRKLGYKNDGFYVSKKIKKKF